MPLNSLSHDERGAAAVELAFLLPMLALLLAGIVDLGRAVWQHQAAIKAARDSVRFLTRAPSPWSDAAYQAQALNLARTGSLAGDAPLLANNISATFTYPTGAGAGLNGSNRMVVGEVSFDFEPFTGFGLLPTVTLRAAHAERHIGE